MRKALDIARSVVLRLLPWLKVLALTLWQRRPHRPSFADGLLRYVIDAAKAERVVAFGALLTVLVFIGLTAVWVFIAAATWRGLPIFIATVTFLTFAVSLGLSLPVFFMVAWPRLFMRRWTITRTGIVERWVNPIERLGVAPAYLFTLGNAKVIVNVDHDGVISPMPTRRDVRLYTDVDITNALDKRRVEDHFMPTATHWNERINQALLVGLIMFSMFWAFALITGDAGV